MYRDFMTETPRLMKTVVFAALVLAGPRAYAQTVGSDGSLSASYSFSLPPARGKYQPSLGLSYSSNINKPSDSGVGWSLSTAYVEADPRATLNQDGTARLRYMLVSGTGSRQLLVAVAGTSPQQYRPDVSSGYQTLVQSNATTWTTTDGVGTRFTFSCIPSVSGSTPISCSRWFLTSALDVDGNLTQYSYLSPSTSSQTCVQTNVGAVDPMLQSVSYNFVNGSPVHQVNLAYGTAGQIQTEAVDGCLVTHALRLTGVSVTRTGAPTQLGSWSLSYVSSPDTGRDLLASIQAQDRNGVGIGVPTTYAYEANSLLAGPITSFAPVAQFTPVSNRQDPNIALTGAQQYEWNMTSAGEAFVDLDGDGLPDVVWGGFDTGVCPTILCTPGQPTSCPLGCPATGSTCVACNSSTPNPGIRWARNRGGMKFDPAVIIPSSSSWQGAVSGALYPNNHIVYTVGAPADGSAQALGGPTGLRQESAAGRIQKTNTLLLDFNGDGRPDLITGGSLVANDGCPIGSISVRFSQGQGAVGVSFGSPSCVDASGPMNALNSIYQAGVTYMPLGYDRTDRPPAYKPVGGEPEPQEPVAYTWARLADMNGDGIQDFVVADSANARWLVFLGYKNGAGAWAFAATPYYVNPTGMVDVVSATQGNSNVWIYPIAASAGSVAIMDLLDMNGDGMVDHVVLPIDDHYINNLTGNWVVTAMKPTLDANLGVFASGNRPPAGFVASPFTTVPGDVGAPKAALLDVNGDGRPDYVDGGTLAGLRLFINKGSLGTGGVAPAAIPPPSTTFTDYAPYETGQELIDLDGDGVMDFVNAETYTTMSFYKGRYVKHRSDLLTSVAGASGAQVAVTWGSSADYGVWSSTAGPVSWGVVPGVRAPIQLVEALAVSGPAMDAATTSYVYRYPVIVQNWDDPTGSGWTTVGYQERFDVPGLGKMIEHTTFGSTYATAGVVVASESGVLTGSFAPTQVPSFTSVSQTATTWSTQAIGSGAYPTYLYAAKQDHFRPELSVNAVSESKVLSLDALGHATQLQVVGDALSASNTTYYVSRSYANSDPCRDCLFEEKIASDSGFTNVLMDKYLHYDVSSAPRNAVNTGHLAFIEYLATSAGAFEVPSVTVYNLPASPYPISPTSTSGLPAQVVKTYTGQGVSKVTQNFVYDSTGTELSQLRVDSVDSSNVVTSLFTDYLYDGYGAIVEQHGPYLAGAGSYPIAARAYDSVGRVALEAQAPISNGSTNMPVRMYTYSTPTSSTPGSISSYSFVRGSTQALSYTLGSPPANDDATMSTRYFDGLGRTIQIRTRLGSGTSGSTGNVVSGLPAQFVVAGNIRLDGLGRTVVAYEPYFSNTGGFVDPRSLTDMAGLSNLHASSIAYDDRSRPICQMYAPAPGGNYVAAPTDPTQCVSNPTENSSYRRAVRLAYGVDSSLDGRNYLTVDATPDWAAAGAVPARSYLDALGRTRYSRTPTGTFEQTMFDLLGERTGVVRTSGPPASATASVTSSWTYDKRGRVASEFADASGTKYYSYLPTGELVQVIQNATTTANSNAVWSTFKLGSFGRIVERDDSRYLMQTIDNCQQSTAQTDVTRFAYDQPYNNQGARYGTNTAGLLTSITTQTTTIALGYDVNQVGQLRDEWLPDGSVHTVAELFGVDGRLLQRTVTSPTLTAYGAYGAVGYAVGYDSLGHPAKVIGPYVPATFSATLALYNIASTPAANTLWSAGSGTDPATGAYDELGRLAGERWDAGAIAKSRTFLPGSNLLGSDATRGANSNNIYTTQYSTWQGSLLAAYTVTSHQEGAGTVANAAYDADGHLRSWSATPAGAVGASTQQFNEVYGFNLENLSQVSTTNSLGFTMTAAYQYNDSTSKERVTAITVPGQATGDYFAYDRRGRGLLTQHMLTPGQSPPQDSYEYDVQARLISISSLGAKVEDLAYDGAGSLVGRTFAKPVPTASGSESSRYYMGDDLTIVNGQVACGTSPCASKQVGYVHVRVGGRRFASFWAKSAGGAVSSGMIYYHRDMRGSVVATTTPGGVEANSYRYLPSGAVDKVVGTEVDETASELGYIGGIKLSGGLVHLRARAYSPLARRFLQADTVDFARYTYARGDSLNYSDPTGRYRGEPGVVFGPGKWSGASVEGMWGYRSYGDSTGVGPGVEAAGTALEGLSANQIGVLHELSVSEQNRILDIRGGLLGLLGNMTTYSASSSTSSSPAYAANDVNPYSLPPSQGPTAPEEMYDAPDAGRALGEDIDVRGTRTLRPRLPDFIQLSWSVPIPGWVGQNLFKSVGASWAGSLELTRHGRLYHSEAGAGLGKSKPGIGLALTGNWLALGASGGIQKMAPSEDQLNNFLQGTSYAVSGGFLVGGQVTYVPGAGTAVGIGAMTPQIGAQPSYGEEWDSAQAAPFK